MRNTEPYGGPATRALALVMISGITFILGSAQPCERDLIRVNATDAGISLEETYALRLKAVSLGAGKEIIHLQPVKPHIKGPRTEYRYEKLIEWFERKQDTIEHGFTIPSPPHSTLKKDSSFMLHLGLKFETSLAIKITDFGNAVEFCDADIVVFRYDNLHVYDNKGKELTSGFSRSGKSIVTLTINTLDASYPLTVDPILRRTQKKVSATDGSTNDLFGCSVSIYDAVMVVGANQHANGTATNRGAVYVFERDAGGTNNWGQIRELAGSDSTTNDQFGSSAAIDGNVIITGAPRQRVGSNAQQGSAYIFERNAGGTNNWGQVKKITAASGAANDYFGCAVAIDGDVAVVGANGRQVAANPSQGIAYIFEKTSTGTNIWKQVKELNASDGASGDNFGSAVGVAGDVVAIGATRHTSSTNNSGAVYIYERNSGGTNNWGQVKEISGSDSTTGCVFGCSIDITGDTIIVGAKRHGVGTDTQKGAAYVFERNTGGTNNWGQGAKLTAADGGASNEFGYAVAADGNILVSGACNHRVGTNMFQGSAYVFERNTGGTNNWGQIKELISSDGNPSNYFGVAVSVDGDIITVGAYRQQVGSNSIPQGAVYVFNKYADDWNEIRTRTAADGLANDSFGVSSALAGDVIVAGASGHQVGANSMQGAAYVYERHAGSSNSWSQLKRLTASDGAANDYFGCSSAAYGDVIVVGAYNHQVGANAGQGAAYVFERNLGGNNNWGQVKELAASDGAANEYFARFSVSTCGDIIVVGSHGHQVGANSMQGALYLYERNAGGTNNWGQLKKLTASDGAASDQLGYWVSMAGDVIAAGACGCQVGTNVYQGAVYVYERNAGGTNNWGQGKKLIASDGAANDYFGRSVGLYGDIIVVGADWHKVGANVRQGAAYVFSRNAGGTNNWGQLKKLTASDGAANDWFGRYAASVDGDTIVIGSDNHKVGTNTQQGAVYVYQRNYGGTNNWGQLCQLTGSDSMLSDRFGSSISLHNDMFVVGAASHQVGSNIGQGAIYLFQAFYNMIVGPKTITAMSINTNNSDIIVTWEATNEPLYRLQYATSLTNTAIWNDVTPGHRSGPSNAPWRLSGTNVNSLNQSTSRFYRVVITP